MIGTRENRGLLPVSTSVRLLMFFALPAPDTILDPSRREGREVMDVVHPRCAGIDISKKDAKVCVRVAGQGRRNATETVRTWGATTNQILALREHLEAERVSLVVMEATSDYWKPFYYLLEDVNPSGPPGAAKKDSKPSPTNSSTTNSCSSHTSSTPSSGRRPPEVARRLQGKPDVPAVTNEGSTP